MISPQKTRVTLATMFQWAGVVVGLLIMGSCATLGVQTSGLEGIAAFLAGLVVAIFLAGWIFLAAGLCKDVIAIRQKLTSGEKDIAPAPDAVKENKRPGGTG